MMCLITSLLCVVLLWRCSFATRRIWQPAVSDNSGRAPAPLWHPCFGAAIRAGQRELEGLQRKRTPASTKSRPPCVVRRSRQQVGWPRPRFSIGGNLRKRLPARMAEPEHGFLESSIRPRWREHFRDLGRNRGRALGSIVRETSERNGDSHRFLTVRIGRSTGGACRCSARVSVPTIRNRPRDLVQSVPCKKENSPMNHSLLGWLVSACVLSGPLVGAAAPARL